MLTGTIIENSLENTELLKDLEIVDTRREGEWTLHTVRAKQAQLPDLARTLDDGPWYMHFWDKEADELIVLYKHRTFRAQLSDPSSHEEAIAYGRNQGIPEEQLDFRTD